MIGYNYRNETPPNLRQQTGGHTTIPAQGKIAMQVHATTRVECVCLRCEAQFTVKASKVEHGRGKYCSRVCAYPPRVKANCATCGAPLSKPPSQVRGKASLFCSRVCMGASHRVYPDQRLTDHVDRSGGEDACWPWTGKRNPAGYGVFEHIGRSYGAHRVAWEIANEQAIPDDRVIRHRVCNNPPCCNLSHLAIGTDQDNSDDAVRAGRVPRGERSPRAVLTLGIVREIRDRRANGQSVSAIARSMGLVRTTVGHVVNGRTWVGLS